MKFKAFDDFQLFHKLPVEIRLMIWKLAIDKIPSRIVKVWYTPRGYPKSHASTPAVLLTNKESRQEAVKVYSRICEKKYFNKKQLIKAEWVDWDKDIFMIEVEGYRFDARQDGLLGLGMHGKVFMSSKVFAKAKKIAVPRPLQVAFKNEFKPRVHFPSMKEIFFVLHMEEDEMKVNELDIEMFIQWPGSIGDAFLDDLIRIWGNNPRMNGVDVKHMWFRSALFLDRVAEKRNRELNHKVDDDLLYAARLQDMFDRGEIKE